MRQDLIAVFAQDLSLKKLKEKKCQKKKLLHTIRDPPVTSDRPLQVQIQKQVKCSGLRLFPFKTYLLRD